MNFSVLMSVYKNDNPEFLHLALKSIYDDQTVKPHEIIIVFDGPLTDALYQTVDAFAADKGQIVKIVRLDTNDGLGNALQAGTALCTCQYIFRMDSDDISAPTRFEKQMSFAQANPDVDCFGTYISEFTDSPAEALRQRIVPLDHQGIVKMAKTRSPMNHVSVCIKRSALLACKGYAEVKLLEDYYLWLKMIVSGCTLANIPEALVYVRTGHNFSAKRSNKERVQGWKFLQDFMVEHHMIGRLQAARNMLYIWVFVNIPPHAKDWVYRTFLRKKRK